ncbi:MAG: SUMF1/EgtB/PvdO family nonheme iron enzyme, partial [Planctomycetes bacterium]|nr:SUMF1/EgtB/PvdO family nonheme iron enzyme [Planctomycetota bacterium]
AEACDEALRVKPGDAGAEEKKRKIRQAEVEWRYEEAMGRAERHLAAKEWVQAAEACDEALRVKPGDAGAKDKKRKIRQAEVEWRYEEAMSRAAKHLAAKEWVEAGEACEEALGLKPENTAATELKRKIREAEREWRYRDAIGRAERHLKAREWKQAREACDEALVAKPGDAPARELKANATSKAYDEAMREAAGAEGTDDLGTAEAAYRCALALKPGDENASAGLKRLKEPLVICLDESRRVKMEFVHIKAGKFTMGSNQFDDEKPPHTVTISRDFWMQRTEVTQAQWMAIMGTNPSNRKGDDLPVECVSWDDCKSFLAKLKEKCGSQLNGRVARLPTEAEWEYACRAGSTGQWCFGDDSSDLREYAWGEGISGDKTQPVGQKKGNAWGVYDMHGNVSEWCEDSYGSYSSRAATDPTGGSGTGRRIVRGGSWSYYGHVEWRSAGRHREYPSYIHYLLGMRAVLRAK